MHTFSFVPNDKGNPPGKLADAEVHFTAGPLAGLKLVGFAVWERRGGGRNVTFPARQYSVNGERRSFALLRPVFDSAPQDRLRDEMLAAYATWEAERAQAPEPEQPVRRTVTTPYAPAPATPQLAAPAGSSPLGLSPRTGQARIDW